MLKVTGLDRFLREVDQFTEKAAQYIEQRVVAVARQGQNQAALLSPVFSGDMASNWNLSVGSPDTSFVSSGLDYFGPDYPAARSGAWGRGRDNLSSFKLGQIIYLANSAEHDEPYAWKVEAGVVNFRPENEGKDRVAERTSLVMGAVMKLSSTWV